LQQRLKQEAMTITGDGTQTRDFTHVSDVVRAMLLAAGSDTVKGGEVINIGGGRSVSVNEVAALIGGPRVHIEKRLEPHDTLADISRARELLGWEPKVSFEQGVLELLKLHGLA
jgi:UDP-glucose 4-epimerase